MTRDSMRSIKILLPFPGYPPGAATAFAPRIPAAEGEDIRMRPSLFRMFLRNRARLWAAGLILVPLAAMPGERRAPGPEPRGRAPRAARAAQAVPTPGGLERALFNEVNRERAALGLPVLRPSPALAAVARAHSADMAARGALGHLSADGATYTRRLEAAGVLFAANGENVGASNTADPGKLHAALMNTGGHRENILNAGFDELGVGAARAPDGTWYVTQAFIGSVAVRPEAEVRALLLAALDSVRAGRGLPPLLRSDEAHAAARALAQARSRDLPYPEVPEAFGATRVGLYAGPDVGELAASIAGDPSDGYAAVGVGSVFARTAEHPGGAYFVCVLLLAGGPPL